MFRRRSRETPSQPEWRARFERARGLIRSQSPPPWMIERLDALDRMLVEAEADHDRLDAALAQLDVERATSELKAALRSQSADPSPQEQQLVESLRARYETIHDLINRKAGIRRSIDRALVDVDLVAARAVELGARADRWQLDETVERLRIDIDALEQAHGDVAGL